MEDKYEFYRRSITEVAPLVPDVIEIINYIKAADWALVANKALEAISKLVPAAQGCIAAFKKEVNLEAKPTEEQKFKRCKAKCSNFPDGKFTSGCMFGCTFYYEFS